MKDREQRTVDVSVPLPGLVVQVHVDVGADVAPGQALVTVETMKCESTLMAPVAGTVVEVAAPGGVVAPGAVAARLAVDRAPVPPTVPASITELVPPVGDAGDRSSDAPPVLAPGELVAMLEATGDVEFEPLRLEAAAHGDVLVVGPPDGADPGDLTAEALRDVAVAAGLIRHRIRGSHPGAPQGTIEAVWVAGDKTHAAGAVGEAECRVLIAALDLAERRGLPVEWVSLSSGARISMSSGTENMDWTAAVVRRLVTFTQAGGVVNVVAQGPNVGAQAYWIAEAAMLQHCRGVFVMVDNAALVLTGNRGLAIAGGEPSPTEHAIGGYDEVMGPNGEAHHRATDLAEAYRILAHHYALTLPGETADPADRDVGATPYEGVGEHQTVGDVVEAAANPSRVRPFSIRPVMSAVVDTDAPALERWPDHAGADGVVVWESRLGGRAVTLVGIESHHRRPEPSGDPAQASGTDTPAWWASGTFYPQSAKKLARALNSASGRRPAVVLANLAGFDGSRWSLRHQQLEFGAELARAVVNFDGPLVVVVIGRFHGGAYVVLNRRLNPNLQVVALEGRHVSVIGGQVAAEVVLRGDVRRLVDELVEAGVPPEVASWRARRGVASAFDATHSVHRALEHGSVDRVVSVAELRPTLVHLIGAA